MILKVSTVVVSFLGVGPTYSANGSLATQNLISVFGDNVTITGLTLMPKVEPNKTIEVIGEDFTLEDVVFAPNTKVPESLYDSIADVNDREDLKQWGGSLYFSYEGNHVIKNVTINNGGVSFRYSPSGTDITFDNVEIVNETNVDWINGYRFSSAFNNSGNSTTGLPQVTYRINDTLDNPKVVVTDLSPITVNAGSVAGASIDYSSLLTDDNSTKTTGTLPATTINSDVANVTILADTIVTGPTGWDGVIDLPSAGLSGGTAPSGFTVGGTVIEVGSPSITLNFNKAVKITLLGVTGDVGYKPAGSDTWQTIDTQCTSATDSSNISSGECYFTSGNDTVIWTYHFTSFGGLNPVLTSSGGGSGGSSSGTRIRDRVEPTPLVLGVTDSLLPTDEELTGVLTSISGILAGIQSGYEAGDISDEDATKLVAQLSEILTILLGLYQ